MKPGSQCGNFRGIVFRHGFEAECLVLPHLPLVDKTEAMQIVPTEAPGESDVVIDVKRTKRWSVVASVDNSGSRDTGKLRGSLATAVIIDIITQKIAAARWIYVD